MRSLFVVALALLPLSTLAADRPSRSARMEATYASGYYEPTRGAALELRYSDANPYSLTLAVPGRKLSARIWRTNASRCGDKLYARLVVPNEGVATDIELIDFSAVRCRIYVKHHWHAIVNTQEADGTVSHLELEGDPAE